MSFSKLSLRPIVPPSKPKMSSLLKLPNEVLLSIFSHASHISDFAHLALTCRRLNHLATPLLYGDVVINSPHFMFPHQFRYIASTSSASYLPPEGYSAFHKFRITLGLRNTSLQTFVNSLSLRVDYRPTCGDFSTCEILQLLPSLQHFYLEIVGNSPLLSPRALGDALSAVCKTLKTLFIWTNHRRHERDGTSIGSLRRFTSLQRLGLQSHVLLGDGRLGLESNALGYLFPDGLEELQIQCQMFRYITDPDMRFYVEPYSWVPVSRQVADYEADFKNLETVLGDMIRQTPAIFPNLLKVLLWESRNQTQSFQELITALIAKVDSRPQTFKMTRETVLRGYPALYKHDFAPDEHTYDFCKDNLYCIFNTELLAAHPRSRASPLKKQVINTWVCVSSFTN